MLLQEQVASAQLDLEQSRHAAIAEKAHLESELRERQEDLEVCLTTPLTLTPTPTLTQPQHQPQPHP